MKIALIADVHGNLPALEAVLADAAKQEIATIWHAGDAVGYGPFPDQVVRRLREVCARNILGNYDRKVLDFPKRKKTWRQTKAPEKYLAFRWTYESLSRESRRTLRALPESRRFVVRSQRVLLTHGSPESAEEHLGPDTPSKRLADLAARTRADLVCCGHSHRPLDRRAGGVRFINPGSVGRPEGDWRAAYAILEFGPRALRVRFRRISYPVEETVEALRAFGLPEAFAAMLRQGRPLAKTDRPARRSGVPPPPCPRAEDRPRLAAVRALATRCRYEADHTHQVTQLALRLFDLLRPAHDLGPQERFLLQCGGMLHDIGWIDGTQGHHKAALRLIREARELPLAARERELVALIARYHRKAPPCARDPEYAALRRPDRRRLRLLAGILRVADGLDRSHAAVVRDIGCTISPQRILLRCRTTGTALTEQAAAAAKGTLLEHAFRRRLEIRILRAGSARERSA